MLALKGKTPRRLEMLSSHDVERFPFNEMSSIEELALINMRLRHGGFLTYVSRTIKKLTLTQCFFESGAITALLGVASSVLDLELHCCTFSASERV